MDIFVNTRPAHQPDIEVGMMVKRLPLLELVAHERLSADEMAYLHSFIKGDIDAVVAVSADAVRYALAHLSSMGIHHLSDLPHRPTFIAVGEATRHALGAFGAHAITPCDFDLSMNNEGMIKMPAIKHLKADDTLMIWRGDGGRRLLYDTLVHRGVNVLPISFYQRVMPKDAQDQFKRFYETLPPNARLFVLITSAQSLEVWQTFHQKNCPTIFLALGERLSAKAKKLSDTICINDLNPHTLTDALTRHTP